MRETCLECGKEARWVRVTQFSGRHHFCKKCAKKESDFKDDNSSYFFWKKLEKAPKLIKVLDDMVENGQILSYHIQHLDEFQSASITITIRPVIPQDKP